MIGAVVWTMRGIMCAVNAVSRDGIALCIYSPFGTNVRYIPLPCFFALFPHEVNTETRTLRFDARESAPT